MADALTQADIDKAVEEATGGLKSKVEELIASEKKLKQELRSKTEIKPEDYNALESENATLRTENAALGKSVKSLTAERDVLTKTAESASEAAKNYVIDAELATHANQIGVIPELMRGFRAAERPNLKAEIVDGKYVVTTADGKPLDKYFSEVAASDEGKHYVRAAANGGGGAQGGGRGGEGKLIAPEAFNSMNPKERAAKMAEGYGLAPSQQAA